MKGNVILSALIFFATQLIGQDSTKTSSTNVQYLNVEQVNKNVSMITNRPGFTEASRAVYKGGLQFELGLEYGWVPTSKNSAFYDEHLNLPNLMIQYGVSKNVEIRLFGTPYGDRSNWRSGVDKYQYEIEELYLGTKINLNVNSTKAWVPEMALVFNQGIPTNTGNGSKSWPTIGLVAWSYSLPKNFGLSGNLGYINNKYYADQIMTFAHDFSYTLNLGYAIKSDFGVFVEIFGSEEIGGTNDLPWNADGGVWYRINNKFQIDGSAGYGFNDGSYFYNGGFSWLILR